jgi:hypothetical protein
MTTKLHPCVVKACNLALAETALTKAQALLMAIKLLVDAGIPVDQAMDFVLGAGTYREIADSVWEQLQPS